MNAAHFRFRFGTVLVAFLALTTALLASTPAQAIQWSSYYTLPNSGSSPSSPTSIVYQGQLYVFTRGFDNNVHYNVLNGSWGPYLTVPYNASTASAPEPVVFNGLLYVFIRGYGGDNSVYYTSFNGSSWAGYSQVPYGGQTGAEPVPVVHNGILYVFIKGVTDNKIYYTDTTNPAYSWSSYSEMPPGGATTSAQIGSTVFSQGGTSYLLPFYRGLGDNRIYYTSFAPYNFSGGGGWSNYYSSVPGNVYTDSGPVPVTFNGGSLSATNNDLFLFFKGAGNGQVNYSILNEATNSWTGPFQIPYGPYGSYVSTGVAPSAVVYNNYLFVFQKGSNNTVYYTQGTF